MNQTQLAQLLEISKAQVSALAKRGMPLDTLEAAQIWRAQHIDPARRKGQRHDKNRHPDPMVYEPTGGESFDSARTREKIAAANLVEMQASALRGTYLVKEDFERHLFNATRLLRDTLTTCARRIGAEVSNLTGATECEAVIEREIRAALASFSQAHRTHLNIEIESSPATPTPTLSTPS